MIVATEKQPSRITGRYETGRPGPLLLALGAMHGNEPAGVLATRRVLDALEREAPPLLGRLVALTGNLGALERGVRYLDADLNRIWTAEALRISALGEDSFGAESREQRDLRDAIERELSGERDVILLDLHSTSADGPPFSVIGDTLKNRRIARALKAPVILGLEENVEGTLLGYFGERGLAAIGFEGGQNDRESTIEHHEAALWLALVAAGMLEREHVPDIELHETRLEQVSGNLPMVVEILLRHGLEPDEHFVMQPGFENFSPVTKGQLLASGRSGDVRSHLNALLLLPRYQGQGLDGFFLARPVAPVWLHLSRVLRRTRMERLLGLLPGVRLADKSGDRISVDTGVARFLALQVFHLLGYRRRRVLGKNLVFERRREALD